MRLRIMDGTDRDAPNILITRLSAIGDCILTMPLAVEIKELWPESHITWVVDCGAAALLDQHSAVDEVMRIERKWPSRPADWSMLRLQLQERRIDMVFDPQGLTKSAALGWLSGAKKRIGFDYSHGREIAPLLATKRVRRTHRHMVDTYRELLRPFKTIEQGTGRFDMPLYRTAALEAESMLHKTTMDAEAGWIAINPGAGWSTKQWPVQRFGMLAREIYQQYGRRSLVFWAGDDELLMAKVIEEESRGAAVVAPATSLQHLVELIRRASLMVTGDTGPMHMASAVQTPCVALHGVTWADESGPYGNRSIAVQSPVIPPNHKTVRKGRNIAMQAIEVDEVLRACGQLLVREVCERRLIA